MNYKVELRNILCVLVVYKWLKHKDRKIPWGDAVHFGLAAVACSGCWCWDVCRAPEAAEVLCTPVSVVYITTESYRLHLVSAEVLGRWSYCMVFRAFHWYAHTAWIWYPFLRAACQKCCWGQGKVLAALCRSASVRHQLCLVVWFSFSACLGTACCMGCEQTQIAWVTKWAVFFILI